MSDAADLLVAEVDAGGAPGAPPMDAETCADLLVRTGHYRLRIDWATATTSAAETAAAQLDAALAAFRRARALVPTGHRQLLGQANVLRQQGLLSDALAVLHTTVGLLTPAQAKLGKAIAREVATIQASMAEAEAEAEAAAAAASAASVPVPPPAPAPVPVPTPASAPEPPSPPQSGKKAKGGQKQAPVVAEAASAAKAPVATKQQPAAAASPAGKSPSGKQAPAASPAGKSPAGK
jgi:hypothetical protein